MFSSTTERSAQHAADCNRTLGNATNPLEEGIQTIDLHVCDTWRSIGQKKIVGGSGHCNPPAHGNAKKGCGHENGSKEVARQ